MSGMRRYASIRRRSRARRGRRVRPAPAHPARSPPGRAWSAPTSATSRSSSRRRRRPSGGPRARSPPASAASRIEVALQCRRRHRGRTLKCWRGLGRASCAVAASPAARAAMQPTLRSRCPRKLRQARRRPRGPRRRRPGPQPCHPGTRVRRPGTRGCPPCRSRRELPRPRRPPRRIVRRLRPDHPELPVPLRGPSGTRRELNRSPIASARSRPSSAAARTASGSPATMAPAA